MATNQTERVMVLLKRFNNGQNVCIEALQSDPMWEGKSEKTIRRDLDVIRKYFPDSFELIRGSKGEKGCYKALTQEMFENFMDKDTIAFLIQTFNIAQKSNILNDLNISEDDRRILLSRLQKSQSCYEFISKPFEDTYNKQQLMRDLENCIQWKRYITLQYQEKERTATSQELSNRQ